MAHSVSRSTIIAGLIAGMIIAFGASAEAKKKKAEPAASTEPGDSASEEKKPVPAAAQAGDVERPKPILDDGEAADGPKADAQGNVSFQGSRSGKGKITVQAPVKEKVKVYLEGRYFGLAPRTINKIPSGDYIVEIVFPNGKSLSKPVSVSGEEEALVQVGAADAAPTAPVEKPMSTDQATKRWNVAKAIGIGSAGALVVGLGLGYWKIRVQKDYNDEVSRVPDSGDTAAINARAARLQSLENKGSTLALTANILYIAGAVGLVTAVVVGYPAYKALHAEQKTLSPEGTPTNLSFMVAPTPAGAMGGLSLRF